MPRRFPMARATGIGIGPSETQKSFLHQYDSSCRVPPLAHCVVPGGIAHGGHHLAAGAHEGLVGRRYCSATAMSCSLCRDTFRGPFWRLAALIGRVAECPIAGLIPSPLQRLAVLLGTLLRISATRLGAWIALIEGPIPQIGAAPDLLGPRADARGGRRIQRAF
jgi:hypothetical protein